MNTYKTKELVKRNKVVALKADKTHPSKSQEVNDLLVELGNYGKTIPFYAIYPAGSSEPILLDGLISQSQVLAALEQAGPSRAGSPRTAMKTR